ncbi:hypothetical protein FB45DRAFT_888795, partial [Roridomyces roridus]
MFYPSTPHRTHSHQPFNSSPLTVTDSSSPASSPIAVATQTRRRSQYKATRASLSPACATTTARLASLNVAEEWEDGQALRTRMKQRCIQRASKARERAVQKKRYGLLGSDDMEVDGVSMEEEEDEDDDGAFDELLARITNNDAYRAFMRSYEREVGSEPVNEELWEAELAAAKADAQAFLLEERDALAKAAFADFADIPLEELFSTFEDVDM